MFRFLGSLLNSVARGLEWALRHSLGIVGDAVEGMFTGMWRAMFPPPAEAEESTADVLREVAGMIAGQQVSADQRAETERSAPKVRHVTEAVMRRRLEGALAYTDAYLRGDRLPSLAHVGAELFYELSRIKSRQGAETLHREIMGALGIEATGWERSTREVLAPGPNLDDEPALRYA